MRRLSGATLLAVTLILAQAALAQEKNELSGVFGRTFISDEIVPGVGDAISFEHGITFEIDYSRLVKRSGWGYLSVEVPVFLGLDQDLATTLAVVPQGYRAYFVTPSAHFTFAPGGLTNPWLSVGGGVAHFAPSSALALGGANASGAGNNTAVLQLGGGIDVRVSPSVSMRGELRDFYTGVPQLNASPGRSRQHNLVLGAGLVWHF